MLVIRGNRRVADIYFTEFNRLFNHYYFRAVQEDPRARKATATSLNLFLDETGERWIEKYAPGQLRAKRIGIYSSMAASDRHAMWGSRTTTSTQSRTARSRSENLSG